MITTSRCKLAALCSLMLLLAASLPLGTSTTYADDEPGQSESKKVAAALPALPTETEPAIILAKSTAAYEALENYSAEGTIHVDMDREGKTTKLDTVFEVKLKKPNLYLVTWTQSSAESAAFKQSGAVWSDGTQPYLYMGVTKAYAKIEGDQMALATATGISGGVAHTIPAHFLPEMKKLGSPFARLVKPKLTGTELIGDDNCYVIRGSSAGAGDETLWISVQTYLVRQFRRTMTSDGTQKMPKLTDKQLEASIKASGQEVTEERKKEMREMMAKTAERMKDLKFTMTSTETHEKISTDPLTEEDFSYKVPEGVALKPALF